MANIILDLTASWLQVKELLAGILAIKKQVDKYHVRLTPFFHLGTNFCMLKETIRK